jgi:hypothetical protein
VTSHVLVIVPSGGVLKHEVVRLCDPHTRSGEATTTQTAVSVRLIAGAPVAFVDHP